MQGGMGAQLPQDSIWAGVKLTRIAITGWRAEELSYLSNRSQETRESSKSVHTISPGIPINRRLLCAGS